MIKYQTRIIKEEVPFYVSEKHYGNKKVQVIGEPEKCSISVNFYRDNELLENYDEFNWSDEIRQEFNNLLNNGYGEFLTEEYIEYLSFVFKKYLKYIKEPTIKFDCSVEF